MLKPKASWKGLDRRSCCPVTCTKLYNIVLWLMNLNIIWSVIMIVVSYISFVVSYATCMWCILRWHSIWYIFLILVSLTWCRYKDTLNNVVLWDIETSTCQYFKTTEPIEVKFTGYKEWTHRGLYTSFQSNLKFYIKLRVSSFKGNNCFIWSSMYTDKLKELCN